MKRPYLEKTNLYLFPACKRKYISLGAGQVGQLFQAMVPAKHGRYGHTCFKYDEWSTSYLVCCLAQETITILSSVFL